MKKSWLRGLVLFTKKREGGGGGGAGGDGGGGGIEKSTYLCCTFYCFLMLGWWNCPATNGNFENCLQIQWMWVKILST